MLELTFSFCFFFLFWLLHSRLLLFVKIDILYFFLLYLFISAVTHSKMNMKCISHMLCWKKLASLNELR